MPSRDAPAQCSFLLPKLMVTRLPFGRSLVRTQQMLAPRRLTEHRGVFVESEWPAQVTATVHPSAILRAPDDKSRHEEMAKFIADLEIVTKALKGRGAKL